MSVHDALKESADDLEAELNARYRIVGDGPEKTVHPAMQRQYERDMVTVVKARAALSARPAPAPVPAQPKPDCPYDSPLDE